MLPDLFYILTFSCLIFVSIVGLIFCFIIFYILATNPTCYTVSNLLAGNNAVSMALFYINNIFGCIYGLREDWAVSQPLCIFRAYIFTTLAVNICYAYAIQALGRLFLTVFYKRKYLATYRVHWCMIVVCWTVSILLTVVPFFIDYAYIYEEESRFCILSTKKFAASVFNMTLGFMFPLVMSISIYLRIAWYARVIPGVTTMTSNHTDHQMPNLKREMKVARHMLIILMIYSVAGVPYTILVLWHVVSSTVLPPQSFYLLLIFIVSVFISFQAIALLFLNKQLKEIVMNYFRPTPERVHPIAYNQHPVRETANR